MSSTEFGGGVDPNPYGFDLAKGLLSGSLSDLVMLGDKFGSGVVESVLSINRGYLDLSKSCVAMQYGYTRSVVSSSSSRPISASSSQSGQLCSGMTKTRLDAIGRVKSWRAKSVADGYCYMKMLRPGAPEDKVVRLGGFPTLATVLRSSASIFQSIEDLARFRLVERAKGVYHVAAGGSEGTAFLSAARAYVNVVKVPEGTLGHAIGVAAVPADSGVWKGGYVVGASGGGVVNVSSLVGADKKLYDNALRGYDKYGRIGGFGALSSDLDKLGDPRAIAVTMTMASGQCTTREEFEKFVLEVLA